MALAAPWNTETARLAQAKSVAARRANSLANAPLKLARILPEQEPRYIKDRLARVRKQLRRLDELMDAETDARMLERLATAMTRLAELERVLAGRPLPGSRRPSEERAPRQRAPLLSQTKLAQLQTPSPSAPQPDTPAQPTTPTPTTPQPGTQ